MQWNIEMIIKWRWLPRGSQVMLSRTSWKSYFISSCENIHVLSKKGSLECGYLNCKTIGCGNVVKYIKTKDQGNTPNHILWIGILACPQSAIVETLARENSSLLAFCILIFLKSFQHGTSHSPLTLNKDN